MNLPEAIEKIKPTVVQISFFATNLSAELQAKVGKHVIHQVLGTGFFVNSEGYVITAKHVIDGAIEMGKKIQAGSKKILGGLAITNTENIRGNFVWIDLEWVADDARHDIALLKLERNPFKGEVRSGVVINSKELPLLYGAPTFNLDRPADGTSIAISGYPLKETVLVTNSGALATCWGIEIEEISISGAPNDFRIPNIADVYLADVEVNPGDSGSPVYDIENSTVIGLCVASKPAPVRDQNDNVVIVDGKHYFYSSGLTIVVPTPYIIDLLNKHEIEYKVL